MPGVWNVRGVRVCVLYKCLECIARVAVCGVFGYCGMCDIGVGFRVIRVSCRLHVS